MSTETAPTSLADRISKPEASGRSWADEVNSPIDPTPVEEKTQDEAVKQADEPSTNDQVDGAGEPFGGSGLQEPEYNVQIKLADMQADPNNPLFSATSFEQLGL
jgi:ATP-dependent RNA helicase DDX19/DBP5